MGLRAATPRRQSKRPPRAVQFDGRDWRIRTKQSDRELVQRAAALDHRHETDFVRVAAVERARKILRRATT